MLVNADWRAFQVWGKLVVVSSPSPNEHFFPAYYSRGFELGPGSANLRTALIRPHFASGLQCSRDNHLAGIAPSGGPLPGKQHHKNLLPPGNYTHRSGPPPPQPAWIAFHYLPIEDRMLCTTDAGNQLTGLAESGIVSYL